MTSSLSDQDMAKVVAKTAGYSGSDMRNLIQEACQGPIRDAGMWRTHLWQTCGWYVAPHHPSPAQSRREEEARYKPCGMMTSDQWCSVTLHWQHGHSVPVWSLLKSAGMRSTTSGMGPNTLGLKTTMRASWTTGDTPGCVEDPEEQLPTSVPTTSELMSSLFGYAGQFIVLKQFLGTAIVTGRELSLARPNDKHQHEKTEGKHTPLPRSTSQSLHDCWVWQRELHRQ